MVPSSFRSLRALEHLNVAAVALSLAAATTAVFRAIDHYGYGAVYGGVSTLLFGALWARLLRNPRAVGGGNVRVGWLLSAPLAAANAGLSAGLCFMHDPWSFVVGVLAGATFGAIVWIPALLLTLLCYGLPIAWAQRKARLGLAGQERGELVVGAVSVLMALAAVAVSHASRPSDSVAYGFTLPYFTEALAAGAVVCGALAVAIADARARHRRAFVAGVEAGQIARYRIEPTGEGKALVRVVVEGANYRVADIEEEVARLDGEGLVTRVAGS